jgi:hypothetical protein
VIDFGSIEAILLNAHRQGQALVGGRPREDEFDATSKNQDLPFQPSRIVQRLRHDDAAIDDAGQHVGEIIEVDRLPRRIGRGNAVEDFAKARIPVAHRLGGESAHLAIEQPLLVANACNQAARVAVRQIGHHFGKQLQ